MSQTPSTKKPSVPPATAAGLNGWIEVFKAGTHTAANGQQQTFSQSDLDQMVVNHALGAAPAVLGHPKHDAPAYAWVGEYKREGDSLFAKFIDINPAFERGVQSKAYRNRSVSVYRDKQHGWRVRHVGWLGAVPPAIDGLAPCNFAAAAEDCFEFAAPGYSLVWGLESAARVLRRLRDRMIEKDGLEAADSTLPQYEIDSITEAANTARTQFNDQEKPTLFNQPTGDPEMTISQEDHDKAIADAKAAGIAEEKARTDAATAQFNAASAELTTFKKASQVQRIKAVIDGWKAKGLIVPADEPGLADYMASLEDQGVELNFSKDGVEGKKTSAQFFIDFMAARKPVVTLGAPAGDPQPEVDGTNPHAIAEAAQTYMKSQADKGLTVSLPEAVAYATSYAKKA